MFDALINKLLCYGQRSDLKLKDRQKLLGQWVLVVIRPRAPGVGGTFSMTFGPFKDEAAVAAYLARQNNPKERTRPFQDVIYSRAFYCCPE